jgi:hypothetical protein
MHLCFHLQKHAARSLTVRSPFYLTLMRAKSCTLIELEWLVGWQEQNPVSHAQILPFQGWTMFSYRISASINIKSAQIFVINNLSCLLKRTKKLSCQEQCALQNVRSSPFLSTDKNKTILSTVLPRVEPVLCWQIGSVPSCLYWLARKSLVHCQEKTFCLANR